ncbi:hypothetical protein ABZX93_05685 [Streptomyces sp. NPDC006632]|uniref:hypothetical protein n=1 Tax=Streptomyces sp. NPDC006632 TaxID=3157182 RepID=UPI0033A8DCE2
MATYVAVSDESYDKAIKAGPFELDDPSQYPVQEGTHLVLESDARAAGYYFAADGAFAPAPPASHGDHDDRGGHGKPGKHSHRSDKDQQ